MKTFLRFNVVGAIGITLQLTILALLNHAFPKHYLLTSTLAVELTLLHNFTWHIHYTWPETSRRSASRVLARLLRFHISTGLVSLLGNLVLMRLFVRSAHLPVLVANILTIMCTGLTNFTLAHLWVFARSRNSERNDAGSPIHAQ